MRHISALTLLLLVAAPALAQNNGPWNIPTVATLAQGQGPRRLALPVAASDDEVAVQRSRLIRGGLGRFLQADGQGWSVRFDRRSGLPMLFEGSGISLAGPTAQARARGLLARFPDLFGADEPASFDEDGSDELAFVHARKETGHARDAMLTFVFNHGRLIQIHADRWLPRSRGVADITQADALARLQQQIQSPADLQELTTDLADVALATTAEPPGVFTGLIGIGYDVRLAYIFRFKLPGDIRSFVAYVDAQDGTLLDFFDDNRYEGLVTGGVYPRTSSTAEAVVPFALTRLAGATTAATDLGGGYVYPGGTVSTTLSGSFFALNDTCGAPAASASSSPGDISLGTSTATDRLQLQRRRAHDTGGTERVLSPEQRTPTGREVAVRRECNSDLLVRKQRPCERQSEPNVQCVLERHQPQLLQIWQRLLEYRRDLRCDAARVGPRPRSEHEEWFCRRFGKG